VALWTGWKYQPPPGTPLDPTNGFVGTLTNLWICNWGSGLPVELISGQLVAPQNGVADSLAWYSTPSGSAFEISTGNGYTSPGPKTFPIGMTLFYLGTTYVDSGGDSSGNRLVNTDVAGNGVSLCCNSAYVQNGFRPLVGGVAWEQGFSVAPPVGVVVMGILSCYNVGSTFYWQLIMKQYDTGVISVYSPNSSDGQTIQAGSGTSSIGAQNTSNDNTSYGSSKCLMAGIANQPWTMAQMVEFADNPWQIFASPIPWWVEASAAAAPTHGLFFPATLSLGAGGPFFQTPVNA